MSPEHIHGAGREPDGPAAVLGLRLSEESESALREHLRGENAELSSSIVPEIADSLGVDWRSGSQESRELANAACWYLFTSHTGGLKGMTKTQTCSGPGCERPAMEDDSFNGCRQHRAVFDAQAEAEAWDLAWRILHPWVETAEPIGSDELTKVMKEALDKAEMHVNLAQDDLERAQLVANPTAALSQANSALSDAHDALEGVEPEVLGSEPYWEARRSIARAGKIVTGGQRTSRRKAPPEDDATDAPNATLVDADKLLSTASDLLSESGPGAEEADKVEWEVRRLVLEARRALRSERGREYPPASQSPVEPENGGRASA